MGKKSKSSKESKSSKKGSQEDEFNEEDNFNTNDADFEGGFGGDDYNEGTTSNTNSNSKAIDDFDKKGSSFDMTEAMEMINEKKANLREPGLTSILNYLCSSAGSISEFDQVADHVDDLITYISRNIRRVAGSSKEASLLCSLASLLALNLGHNNSTVLDNLEKVLITLIDRHEGNDPTFRANLLFSYTFSVFVHGHFENILDTLAYLEKIITSPYDEDDLSKADAGNVLSNDDHHDNESGEDGGNDKKKGNSSSKKSFHEGGGIVVYSTEVKIRAVDCWVLLSTRVLPPFVTNTSIFSYREIVERIRENEMFEAFLNLLQSAGTVKSTHQLELKISTGKAIAYLFELAYDYLVEERGEGEDAVDSSIEDLGRVLCYDNRTVDTCLDEIRDIISDNSKKTSKKNKKEQRAEFRDIDNWISNGERPHETIRMQGAEIEVNSFGKQRIVEALKEVLGSGFHSSLRLYPVTMEMLEVDFLTSDMDGGGQKSKILKGSAADKQRTKYMKQDRRIRNDFLGHDEYGDF